MPKQDLAHYSRSTINVLPPPPTPPEFWGGPKFQSQPKRLQGCLPLLTMEIYIKLHYLWRTKKTRLHPIRVWGPSKAFVEGPLSPTLLTLQYHPIHIGTHTQSHSATSQARGLKEHIKSFMAQRWKLRLGKTLPKFSSIWDPTHVHMPAKPPLCKWGN